MMQRHPPVVSYPLQRSRVLRNVWWLWVLGSAAVMVLWWWFGAGFGLRQLGVIGISGCVWVVCSVVSWRALQGSPTGVLRYTGVGWEWECAEQCLCMKANPTVILDMQSLLVIGLHAQSDSGDQMQRFVLQRDWAPDAWADLRRAVYSSSYPRHAAAEHRQP